MIILITFLLTVLPGYCVIGKTDDLLSLSSIDLDTIIDGAVVMAKKVNATFCCKTCKRGPAVFVFSLKKPGRCCPNQIPKK